MMPKWWRNKTKISKVFTPASPNTDTESKGVELLAAIGLKSKQSDKLWSMSLITLSSTSQTKLAALSRTVGMWRLSLSWFCDLSTISARVSSANEKSFRESLQTRKQTFETHHSFFVRCVCVFTTWNTNFIILRTQSGKKNFLFRYTKKFFLFELLLNEKKFFWESPFSRFKWSWCACTFS